MNIYALKSVAHRVYLHLSVLILLFIHSSVYALSNLPASVNNELNRLGLSPQTLSVYVKELKANKSTLNWNGDRAGNPASSIKALTTFAGLDMLGPNYRWPTEFYYTGSLKNGVLNGDIIIKGHGDPFFVNESLEASVAILRQQIKNISGKLIIDNSYFQLPSDYPTSLDGAHTKPYNALPDAMNMNFGTSQVKVTPQRGKNKALVTIDPPVVTRKLVNNTVQNSKKCRWYGTSFKKDNPSQLVVSATPSQYCRSSSAYYVVLKPYEIVAGAFKKEWLTQQGSLSANYQGVLGRTPSNATFLWRHLSEPLKEQIAKMNKKSNNVMTRQLFLTLGATQKSTPGTLSNSREVVNTWLKNSGIDTASINIDNGSGLSRVVQISPHNMVNVLQKAYQHKHAQDYIQSLAIAGVDGTMRKRFKEHPAQGKMFIKTGTLNGVRTMSGYVYAKSGKVFALSSIQQAPGIQNQKGTLVQNKLLDWLYNL